MANPRPAALHVPLEVPAERLARLVGSLREPAILESGPGFGPSGRWSLYAAEPRLRFSARGPWSTAAGEPDPLAAFDDLLRRYQLADPSEVPDADAPPFQGGLIGFFGYDLAPLLERLPRKAPVDSRLPDIGFGLYDTAVTVDHATGAVVLSAHDLLGEGAAALRERVASWRKALDSPPRMLRRSTLATPIASNFTRADYLDAVGRALEYIRAGDVFQVNLSQRFEARGRIEPLDLYLRLRRISPAPFAAFLRWEDLAIVSASPEWFYQSRGDHLVTRPIKGTRPRGRDPEEDARLAEELHSSAKDRAELTMIVDLERNDLGRVCRFGTVRVSEPLVVESFAQVHHLVATVGGRLRPGAGPGDVVRALLPGGSINGAP